MAQGAERQDLNIKMNPEGKYSDIHKFLRQRKKEEEKGLQTEESDYESGQDGIRRGERKRKKRIKMNGTDWTKN